jgi:hypothetical protein
MLREKADRRRHSYTMVTERAHGQSLEPVERVPR